MNTSYTTRLAALFVAVLMTVAVNGAMLSKFDAVAQEGAFGSGGQPTKMVTIESANIVAPRS